MHDPQIELLKFITFVVWFLNAIIGGVLLLSALVVVWRCCAMSRKPDSARSDLPKRQA